MQNSPELKALIRKNAHLFWYIKGQRKGRPAFSGGTGVFHQLRQPGRCEGIVQDCGD
jgi:hypothetical protein